MSLKNVFGLCCVLIFTLVIRRLYLDPMGITESRIYRGAREGTRIIVNVPIIHHYFEVPRFPGDVLVLSPFKLWDFVDVNVLENWDVPRSINVYITRPISEDLSLAYSYLKMLQKFEVALPLRFESAYINYDVSSLVRDSSSGFMLSNIDFDRLDQRTLRALLEAVQVQARSDVIRAAYPANNIIVELVMGSRTRFVWGHYLSGDYLHIFDPVAPQLAHARINLITNEYRVGTDVFRVRSFLRKLTIPVIESDEWQNEQPEYYLSYRGDEVADNGELEETSEIELYIVDELIMDN